MHQLRLQRRAVSALYGTMQRQEGAGAPRHSPDVSLRGAKRRGNLAEPDRTTGKSSAKSQLPSRDCTPRALPRASRSGRHVGLRPPRNDNSEVHTVLTVVRSYRQRCAGRGQPGPYSVRLAASRVTIHCLFSMIRFPAHHIICQGSRQSTGCSPFSCKKALICENGRLPKKPR